MHGPPFTSSGPWCRKICETRLLKSQASGKFMAHAKHANQDRKTLSFRAYAEVVDTILDLHRIEVLHMFIDKHAQLQLRRLPATPRSIFQRIPVLIYIQIHPHRFSCAGYQRHLGPFLYTHICMYMFIDKYAQLQLRGLPATPRSIFPHIPV